MCWGIHAALNGAYMGTCAEALRRDVRTGPSALRAFCMGNS